MVFLIAGEFHETNSENGHSLFLSLTVKQTGKYFDTGSETREEIFS
jgi:hypothetical protein